MQELPKTYNPKETEDKIYELWEKSDAFKPAYRDKQPAISDKPFTIVIPPPNVTGSLHIGHALNNTIQDILIRRSRMQGVPTLWVPGTDHAGIATQNVVEKQLVKEGKTRQELGREEFKKRVWQWVDEYGHIIIDQLKKLGCSCDWSRQRFTMDEDYSEAVKTAFLHYQKKGWIYQGERVINWCTRCQTALSDIELEYRQVEGKLWFIKYPLVENPKSEIRNPPLGMQQIQNSKLEIQNYIIVATTRPETMLGDTAVAVNPKDTRYKALVGQKVIVPLVNRKISIIADSVIDPEFGTGAVKVTPAHDPNDFEIGERHGLSKIKVIDETGRITQIKPTRFDFTGQKTLEARENIVKELEKQGLIEKVEDYTHQVPHCYRCGGPVEQLLSKQWFLKMAELAKPAIEAVESGEIKFVPLRFQKVYLDWMKNLRDWCISRQIWFGHKIPIEGSEDVLDTWFSSALWPIAVFLKKNRSNAKIKNQNAKLRNAIDIFGEDLVSDDLAYFYPTTVLSTARDIIYLWVARMIFSGYEFMGEKPFSTIYIHPTIFNIQGKRMSKSLGTGIDPLDLIKKYGADATRFGLAYINTGTQDIKFDENAILAGQKFANKIWNISRFVIIQMQNKASSEAQSGSQAPQEGASATAPVKRTSLSDERAQIESKTEADKKILDSLDSLNISINSSLDHFRFGQAAHDLYDFIWHDFADRYIEESKKEPNLPILLFVLRTSLLLLHPFMPFITEKIWQKLREQKLVDEEMLITATWPKNK